MLHNPLVVLRPVFDDNIKSATTSTRVTRTKAKVQAEPTVAGQPSADHSKDLAYLKRIRDHDRAKKQRQRGMTTELVRRLDSLLPAPASKKPRTMFETLASASAFLRCRSLNHTQAPAHSLREAMLTVRGAGLLVLDSSLAVIDLRGSFVNQHPSGVEVETLTLESMIGTLQRVDERTEAEEEAEALALLADPQHMHMSEQELVRALQSDRDGGQEDRY